MKTLAMVAIAVAATGTASARNIELVTGTRVPVCVQGIAHSYVALPQAEGLASEMFAAAGVTIEWRGMKNCPADGIQIRLSEKTPESDNPNSYAYALPYEGVHIVVFWDRITNIAERRAIPSFLAHVLVHEVTHILQGTCRHSETGVMKAVYTSMDIGKMELHSLPFTEEDVALIHRGIEARRASRTQNQ
jgi:hypothetical protein